ncbi:kinase-like domain-containing protein [Mycena albidolilacea]|uniref:Kinase-like domain-containing protein n=1 Tax=Mycena albidolilacea TaxID=1033008 RepID=A0AAD7AEA3_9AGAR|nr:kinase-like domain-containing protein [Mycena albidolilacea]
MCSNQVSLIDFEHLALIGSGATYSVYLVRQKSTGGLYALKQAAKLDQSADIQNEQDILKSISGLSDAPKSLLALEASWSDADFYYLLTPWYEGKDLSTLLRNGQKFTADRVKTYMCQLVLAVEALHSLNVIHRDIKPANIFLTRDGNVVLGDFGFAKSFEASPKEPTEFAFDIDPEAPPGSFLVPSSDNISRETCGTLNWMSPAQHAGTDYSYDADVWALGLVMFKMATGRLPFGEDIGARDVSAAYAFDPIDFRAEDTIDSVAEDLIRGLLKEDRDARMTIAEAKAHAYFRGVNWAAAAQHEGTATWAPRKAYVPKEALKKPLINGKAYEAGQGGLPSFVFVRPGFFDPPPGPVKALALKIARIFGCSGRDPKMTAKGDRGNQVKTRKATITEVSPRVEAAPPLLTGTKSAFYDISLETSDVEEKKEARARDASRLIDASDSPGLKATRSLASRSWSLLKPVPSAPRPSSLRVSETKPPLLRGLISTSSSHTTHSKAGGIAKPKAKGHRLVIARRGAFLRNRVDNFKTCSSSLSGGSSNSSGAQPLSGSSSSRGSGSWNSSTGASSEGSAAQSRLQLAC